MVSRLISIESKESMKNKNELTAKVQAVITMGGKVLDTESKGFQQQTFVNEQLFHDFRISGLSLLSRIFGDNSEYYQSFKSEVTSPGSSRTKRGLGILSAAATDLQGNWIETTGGAISSEILTDFLRMAKNHLDGDNLQGAAILAGAVLEEHLRRLCLANDISIINDRSASAAAKKPLQLTGEAYKKKLCDRQQHKSLISWLELCGSADEFTGKQIEDMLAEIGRFLENTPY